MEGLKENWVTERWIDFEYKQYVLLAYISRIKKAYDAVELYPGLSDAIGNYRHLKKLKDNLDRVSDEFPRRIILDELNEWKLSHETIINDELIDELSRIVDYSLPKLQEVIAEGKEIYEFVEADFSIEPIGLVPIYNQEGYLFTLVKSSDLLKVYRYEIKLFDSVEVVRGVALTSIDELKWKRTTTFQNIKMSLVKKYKDLPNPATYLISSTLFFPIKETFLPIAKRLLVKNLNLNK